MSTRSRTAVRLATAAVAALLTAPATSSAQQRVFGVDVSDWQGDLTQAKWNTIYNANKRFAFIRSSRGGTTGYYNESDPNNVNGLNTQSQRYDDLYFTSNMYRATQAGLLVGAYHFDRADILTYTNDAGQTVNHTGTDEANHFLEIAGQWMRPGFLLPVLDFEAGANRSVTSLSTFATDFANRIIATKGVAPIIYLNTSYAVDEVNSTVPAKMPNLWLARPEGNSSTGDPTYTGSVTRYQNVYGVYNPNYPNTPSPAPWAFWQYGSTTISGVGTIDGDVAHGDIEYLKDFLVPAMWTTDASGTWSTIGNWNINAIYDPGADKVINPATDTLLYAARAPQGDDTVILDRGAANPTITLSAPAPSIRRLIAREALTITSAGSLTVTKTAELSSAITLGGSLQADATTFNAGSSLTFTDGGTLTATTLNLNTNVTFTGTTGSALIKSTAGQTGSLNLGNANRTFTVADSSAANDLTVSMPITNGSLTKTGPGTLALTVPASYAGTTTVSAGTLATVGFSTAGGNVTLSNNATLRTDTDLTLSRSLAVGTGGGQLNTNGHTVTLPTALTGNGPFTKSGTGTLKLASLQGPAVTVTGGTLALTPGGSVNTAAGLSLAAGTTFDLANNTLTITTAGAQSSLVALIYNAYNLGHWDTPGLTSSAAATNNATAIGYLSDAASTVLKFTWTGDADLNGIVDQADLARFSTTGPIDWSHGDFNYDGRIDFDDYALLQLGLATNGTNISTLVPEPTSAAACGLALLPLLKRRRRHR